MDPTAAIVKVRRRYTSPRRVAQAQQTREDVLDAAEELFRRDGFVTTTVAAIAEAAAVSVETVYKAFGGKPGLVRALCERALAGAGPVSAETRSDALHLTQTDPYAIIRAWAKLAAEVSPRISPIMLLVRDASAVDPELDRLRADLEAQRLVRMTKNARALAAAGHLRAGVTARRAADVLWLYSSFELFELLVLRQRWPIRRYGDFLADAMIAALLVPTVPKRHSRGRTHWPTYHH